MPDRVDATVEAVQADRFARVRRSPVLLNPAVSSCRSVDHAMLPSRDSRYAQIGRVDFVPP